ncbi:hypothetical protein HDU76_012988, partial [Blyttiomyces sp. JEL0837]
GASGFTGRLVVEYLLTKGPENLNLAIAGRNHTKLLSILDSLTTSIPHATKTPILIADADDITSLDAVVSQTKVVITTMGPFLQHGKLLVESCVRLGTDYVDSTGEPPFIREMVDKWHKLAVENNVRIVPSCGVDSIPSDLGALLVADHFAKKNLQTKAVRYTMFDSFGGVSGGTVASGMGVLDLPVNVQKELANPYYLVEDREDKTLPVTPGHINLYYDKDFKRWQTYFVMEMTNTRYVRRTWSLLKKAWGPNFTYTETATQKGFLSALLIAGISKLIGKLVYFTSFRRFLRKMIPQGSGPSEEVMRKGFFWIKLVGEAEDGSKAMATVKGVEDPGYRETAKMLSESGLCLALQKKELDLNEKNVVGTFGVLRGGILTAASSMGLLLADRLRKAGMTFDVEDFQ